MVTRWLPSREGVAYSLLYLFFRNRSFSLDEAGFILAGKSYVSVRKILSNLVSAGWAERCKWGEYKLRPVEEIVRAVVYTHPLKHPFEVIKSFGNEHPYAISGATAACFHTGFLGRFGDVYELKVHARDTGEWRREFKRFRIPEKGILLPSTERVKYLVVLKPVYSEELEYLEEVKGLKVESREGTIIDCLKSRAGHGAISTLIINRDKLDYERLAEEAVRNGLVKVIGALMEIINREAERKLFDEKIIDHFYEKSRKYRYKVKFSLRDLNKLEGHGYKKYRDILDKWGVEEAIDPHKLRKIVSDSTSLSRH